ncbi:hypothetical protein ACFSCX_16115 [Bacillus salitolerans]|uniref:DUF4021 domain-containing protein n=1 Tax=Bacillus salitolerans TaxID=1437434 RepID=A0ABW4LSL7_9BACI
MKKQEQSEQKETEEMNHSIDDGLNVFVQTVNNMTGLDKSNDGVMNNKE